MLVLGLLLEAAAAAAMGAVPVRPHAGWAFLLLRCAQGTGAALSYTALLAFAAERFAGALATVVGIQEAVSGVGYMIGPPLGGALYTLGGFALPFAVMGAGLLAALPLLPAALPSDAAACGADEDGCGAGGAGGAGGAAPGAAPGAARARAAAAAAAELSAPPPPRFLAVAALPPVANAAAVTLLAGVAFGFVAPTLAPHLSRTLRASEGAIGALFGLCAAAYALAAPAAGLAADALGARRVMCAGVALLSLAYTLLGPSPLFGAQPAPGAAAAWATQCAALLLLGVGAAAAIIPCMPLMEREAAAHAGAGAAETVAALFNGVYCAGEALGPLVGAALVGALGFGWAATVVALLLAAYVATAAAAGAGGGAAAAAAAGAAARRLRAAWGGAAGAAAGGEAIGEPLLLDESGDFGEEPRALL